MEGFTLIDGIVAGVIGSAIAAGVLLSLFR